MAGASKTATKPEESKEVAEVKKGAVPAHLAGRIEQDAGKGVSEDQDDSLVPMLVVLQAQSPQAIKQKPEYLGPGAEAGAIWMKNAPKPVVSGEEGVLFQPCAFWKNVVEWIPKNKDGTGGGFVAIHDKMPSDAKEVKDAENNDKVSWVSPRGTEYVETRNHAGIAYTEDGQAFPYLIPLSSSGHSVSRTWTFLMKNKTVNGHRVPSFACLYRLKTLMRSKGTNTWFVLDPKEAGEENTTLWASEEQYEAGKALHEAFAAGQKKADYTGAQDGSSGGDTGERDDAANKNI